MIRAFGYGISLKGEVCMYFEGMNKKVSSTALGVHFAKHDLVYSVAYDQSRGKCFSGSMDNSVRVWDVRTGECLAVLSGHNSLVGLLNTSGARVLSAAADGLVNIWDTTSNKLEHTLHHSCAVVSLASDDATVLTAAGDTVHMWDIRSGIALWEMRVGDQVWHVVWQRGILIIASRRNSASMFDVYDFR
jgi:F-box and WD-40 domain protein CDC4